MTAVAWLTAGGGGGGGDPYFANVVSLLHFDNNVTDVIGNTWTKGANLSYTTSSKFGTHAITGAGGYAADDCAYTPDNAAFSLGTSDFTVEAWVYGTNPLGGPFFNHYSGAGSQSSFALTWGVDTNFIVRTTVPSTYTVTSSTHISSSVWTHVACVRDGTTLRLFIDGTQTGSATIGTESVIEASGPLQVLGNPEWLGCPGGRVDDFRFTVGVARYTSNFTPPTAAFPDS